MKALMFIIPVIILAVVGAGMTGMVDIPGLTPPKKKVVAKKEEKKVKPKVTPAPPISKNEPVLAVKPVVPLTDAEKGDKKLANLWNAMEPAVLEPIMAKWKDPELAAILRRMDTEKVAELLAKMAPERASKLSREIQRQASIVPPES